MIAPNNKKMLVWHILMLSACMACTEWIGAEPLTPPSSTPQAEVDATGIEVIAPSESIHITVGSSVILTSATPLQRVYVGNPAVLQTFTSGNTEIVLTAKMVGVSSMVLWEKTGGHRLYTISADLDPEMLKGALRNALPDAEITAVTHEGKIYLSGVVANEIVSEAAAKLASMYAKEIINSIRVVPVHAKQVELKLRIIEVDRTKLEQFGVNIFSGGKNAIATSTQQYTTGAAGLGTALLTTTDPLNLLFYNFSNAIGASVKDLEQKQILQVLAEPTLTTMSGLPARFLSGGEFPFPVVQGGVGTAAAITIMFRPYGVKVDFTPTVNADGSIRLKVSPEVSTLDFSNAVTISGFTIPALSTRRAETEVEIKDGQSFVVSGLLDHRTTESLAKVPGIANIPILGQLFRSKNFNHSIVELVVIVTARVVDPLIDVETMAQPVLSVPNMESGDFDSSTKGAVLQAKPQSSVKIGRDKP